MAVSGSTAMVLADVLMKVLAPECFAWGVYLTPVLVAVEEALLGGEVLIHLGIQGVELSIF